LSPWAGRDAPHIYSCYYFAMAIDDLSLQIGMRQLEAEERAKAPALVGKLTELAAKSFRAFLSKDVGQMV